MTHMDVVNADIAWSNISANVRPPGMAEVPGMQECDAGEKTGGNRENKLQPTIRGVSCLLERDGFLSPLLSGSNPFHINFLYKNPRSAFLIRFSFMAVDTVFGELVSAYKSLINGKMQGNS